jgi:hypothetical protein
MTKIRKEQISSGNAASDNVLISDGAGNALWVPITDLITAPQASYTGTKYSIESLTGVLVGSTAYATDTMEPGWYNGTEWTWENITDDWRVTLIKDENANNSDKTFAIPTNTEWQVLWIWVEYTSTATGGSRQLEIQIQDSNSDIIGQFQTGVTQPDNITYKYLFGIGVPDLTSPRDTNNVMTPLPAATFLAENQKIRIWDNKAVDASGDDMIIRLQYAYRGMIVYPYYLPSTRNSVQTQTADTLTLTTDIAVLRMQDSLHAQTSEKATLSAFYSLTAIQDTSQLQTSGSTILVTRLSLIINDSAQLQTSDNTALTHYQKALVVNNTNNKLTSDFITLSIVQRFDITVNNTEQTQTSDNVIITVYAGLEVQDSYQTQFVDNVIIITDIVYLTIHSSTQSQTSDNIPLTTNKVVLRINNTIQLQPAQKAPVNNKAILVVNNSAQSQTVENIVLTFYQKPLTINNATQKLNSDRLTVYAP